jgi:hypothetical protein
MNLDRVGEDHIIRESIHLENSRDRDESTPQGISKKQDPKQEKRLKANSLPVAQNQYYVATTLVCAVLAKNRGQFKPKPKHPRYAQFVMSFQPLQ